MATRSAAFSLALFLAFLPVYLLAARHFAPATFERNDVFFSADTYDTVFAMKALSFEGDMRRHPIFSPVASSLVAAIGAVSGFGAYRCLLLAISILAALNVVGCFLVLRLCVASEWLALGFAALYGCLLSNLVIFSIPETYSVSNLFIAAYLSYLLAKRTRVSRWDAALLSALAGLAALANPPLASLVVVHAGIVWLHGARRAAVGIALSSGLVAATVYATGVLTIYGTSFLDYSTGYVNEYASLWNLLHWRSIATVAASFFLFAIAMPLEQVPVRLYLGDLRGYLAAPLLLGALAPYLGLAAFSAIRALRGRDALALALLGWLSLLLVFYVVFNPVAAMLYSPQLLLAWTCLLASGFAELATGSRWPYYVLAAASAVIAGGNLSALAATGVP